MIKLRLRREGTAGPFIVLGLSDINLTKLRAGMPIAFPLEQLGLGDGALMIMAGENERAMVAELRRDGIDLPGADQAIDAAEARAQRRS